MPRTVFVTHHATTDEVMFTAMEPTTGGFGAHLATCPNTADDVDRIADCILDISPGSPLVAFFPEHVAQIQCRPGLVESGHARDLAS